MQTIRFPSESELRIEALVGATNANIPRNAELIHRLLVALETFREDLADAIVAVVDPNERTKLSALHTAALAARTTVLSLSV